MFAEFWKFQSKIFEIRRGLIRISWMHSALFCIMHYINNTIIEFEQKIVQCALTQQADEHGKRSGKRGKRKRN